MVEPETIVLAGAAFWGAGAFLTGVPAGRIPPEFPFLFTVIAIIGSLIGVTEMLPETLDIAVTLLAVVAFALTPLAATVMLYARYPPNPPPSRPRSLNERH